MENYKSELDALKLQYATWYLDQYLKAHISPHDNQKKQGVIQSDTKLLCDIIRNAPFINPARYDGWLKQMSLLKLANQNVTKESILAMPTAPDGFNPTINSGALPNLGELKDELDEIYANYDVQFHEALEDPTTKKNQDMLSESEKTTIQIGRAHV